MQIVCMRRPLLVRAERRTNSWGFKFNADSPQAKVFKKLEAARVARLKGVGKSIVHTLKAADESAREMWVQELKEMTEATEELLKPKPEESKNAE